MGGNFLYLYGCYWTTFVCVLYDINLFLSVYFISILCHTNTLYIGTGIIMLLSCSHIIRENSFERIF